MPTFHDPRIDAAEASEALRGLAYASRVFDDPADTYTMLGDLLSSVRSLRQVLDQVGSAHLVHRGRARNDGGDHASGVSEALAAADELHHAGTLLDGVEEHVDAAMGHLGRIAWNTPDQEPGQAGRRWISVVFLQGREAEEVLDLIDRDGVDAAITHLRNWDYREETTQAALVNGYVDDEPPAGQLDRTIIDGEYALTYNPFLGQVSLLRSHPAAMSEHGLNETGAPVARAVGGVGPLESSTPQTAPTPATVPTTRAQRAPVVEAQDRGAGPARSSGASGRGLHL